MVHQSNSGGKKSNLISAEQRRLLTIEPTSPDMSETMFNQVGSCFNQLQSSNTKISAKNSDLISSMKIAPDFLENLFKLCKKLLDKDLSQELDKLAETKADNPNFVYKSFSEALFFVTTSLIRELLQTSTSGLRYETVKFDS